MQIIKLQYEPAGSRQKKSRIYFWNKELAKHCRNPSETRTLIPKVLKAFGISDNEKLTWNSKAGCTCGCSPAFVAARLFFRDGLAMDIYATVNED